MSVEGRPRRSSFAIVYGTALCQGMTVVAFPASGTVLRAMHHLSDEAYGSLFVPQTLLTILGSLVAGSLARAVGLQVLLVVAASCSFISQLVLLSTPFLPSHTALSALLVGSGFMGLGFGIAAAPLNTYPGLLLPERSDAALVGLHTVLGAGFSLGPVLVSFLVGAGQWIVFPAIVALGNVSFAILGARGFLPRRRQIEQVSRAGAFPWGPLFGFVCIVVLYAFAEGTFSNWASVYLHEARNVEESTAALAISSFWAALTLGRLCAAALVVRVAPFKLWLTLPLAMICVFGLLPSVQGPIDGILAFGAAGLASSAFFPLTVAIANKRYPGREAVVSSALTAALMVGVGGGSFCLGALRRELSFEAIYQLSMLYPLFAFALGALTVTVNPSIRTGRQPLTSRTPV